MVGEDIWQEFFHEHSEVVINGGDLQVGLHECDKGRSHFVQALLVTDILLLTVVGEEVFEGGLHGVVELRDSGT